MVYKVFADTNVFLDYLLQRTAEWQFAEDVFNLADQHHIEIFTSSSSMVNILFLLKQQHISTADIIQTCTILLGYIKLADTNETIFLQALHAGFSDLEDAVQYYTASTIRGLDYFITSNLRDYKKATRLPVYTPKQFLAIFHAKHSSQ